MNEYRILDKLDAIEARSVETLVEVVKLQEQVKIVPELQARMGVLEKFKWTAMGAAAMAGGSVVAQVFAAVKGAGA
jgi:hypothetical protein